MPRQASDKIRLSIDVSPDLDEALEAAAEAQGISKAELVRQAVKAYLTGQVVRWEEINGQHIMAALVLLREVVKLVGEVSGIARRGVILEMKEELAGMRELAEVARSLYPQEVRESAEESETNRILTAFLLGFGQRLGLFEVIPEEM